MNITAKDVNELRKKTGAGMMDCKNALVEAKGDFEMAIDVLRKKGQKVASKRSDRSASEGVVLSAVSNDKKFGAMVSVNCETDFVAKNEDFITFVKELSELKNEKNSNTEELKLTKMKNGETVDFVLLSGTLIIVIHNPIQLGESGIF